MKKFYEPVPKEMRSEHASLEDLLKGIAQRKGWLYQVKEWRFWQYDLLVQFNPEMPSIKPGDLFKHYAFVGYKVQFGRLRKEDVLFACFDRPETYDLSRPEGAGENYTVLAVRYLPWHFSPQNLKEEIEGKFLEKVVHLEELHRYA